MFMDHSRQHPQSNTGITLYLLMTILINVGYFSCRKKDQTFTKFCEFKALVEKDSGKKVKSLRSDNNGQYVSNEFKNLCVTEGIKWEFMTPHNPQWNGVAERKNRSIVGVARRCCMIGPTTTLVG